jgi:hypothetical protein
MVIKNEEKALKELKENLAKESASFIDNIKKIEEKIKNITDIDPAVQTLIDKADQQKTAGPKEKINAEKLTTKT